MNDHPSFKSEDSHSEWTKNQSLNINSESIKTIHDIQEHDIGRNVQTIDYSTVL